MLFIFKFIKYANNGVWLVIILACFCFMRSYSVTSINFYVTLYSQFICNDILDFFSHAFICFLYTIYLKVIFRDLSPNSINFAATSSAVNRSSYMALTSVFNFFISFSTWNSSWSMLFCVNSELAVKSTISVDNLSRRSVVLFTFEFISSSMLLS